MGDAATTAVDTASTAPAATTVVSTTTPATAATAATATTAAPAAPSEWSSNFSDDLKSYVTERGFKDPAAVVEGYRNLEKLRGVPEDRLLKLPEKADDVEGWKKIFTKLGTPESPEGYSLPKEGNDPKVVEAVAKMYFESGLTAKQAEVLNQKMAEYVGASKKASQEALEAKSKQEDEALRKEWGQAFEQNKQMAKAAALKYGVTEEMINSMEKAIGLPATMKHFYLVGSKLGEGKFVTGADGKASVVMTPGQAKARRDALSKDPSFGAKLLANDVHANEEWNRLHELMSPEIQI